VQAGLDSLGAVELRNSLSARFGVDLPATIVFDHPTVNALAAHIARQLATGGADSGSAPADSNASDLGSWLAGSSQQQGGTTTDIVGVGCLYPGVSAGSTGFGGFWEAAAAGANLQQLVPYKRWDVDWCYSAEAAPDRSYARFAAFAEVSGMDGASGSC